MNLKTNLAKKSCLVYDYGLFIFLAQRLAEDFKEVFYFTPWKGSYPLKDKHIIGEGVPGLTNVKQFFDVIDKVDIVVFFDVGDGDLQEFLREQGKIVFGTGKADKLEMDRVYFKQLLKSHGLPVGKYQIIKGMDALHELLKKETNKYIKISTFRGTGETFYHKNYKTSLVELDRQAQKLGAYRQEQEYIVEDHIDGVELGSDWILSDGEFLSKGMLGYEVKDEGYIGKVLKHDQLPEPILKVDNRLSSVYKKLGVKGFLSSEVRVGEDHLPYFIDMCARSGSPPSENYPNLYKNFSQIVWAVAHGEMITPEPSAEYTAGILIKSEIARDNWLPLDFPEKAGKNLKFRNLCRIKGQYYYVPQDHGTIIGAAVGYGDILEEAETEALKVAEQLESTDTYYNHAVFDDADEELDKVKKYGLGRF